MVNGLPDDIPLPSLAGYEVLAYAGSGGTAHVFRVRSTTDGREAALKVLRSESSDEDLFRNEFAVLSSIEHPNILPALDYGVTSEGKPYVIFPWIAFDPLRREAFRDEKGVFRADRFALVVRQIADALAAVHTRGIVHGDLKPGNIALTFGADGKPSILLMDFGLCRPIRTSGGGLSGTLEYIAPELIRGEPPTPASDLYALGCLLFECLTGSPPFVGDSPREVLRMHLAAPPAFPSPADGIPAACIEWVRTLMEKDPAFRYRSAAHLAAAVDSFLGGAATGTAAVSTPLILPAIPRDIEDAKLRELLAASRDHAVTAVVTGADGVGKSTLIRRLRAHVLLEGESMTIAVPRPGDPPFRPVLDLLRGIPRDRLAGEAAQHASVLADAFGNLFPGFEPSPVHALPVDAAKLRLFHAAAALLTEASPCRVAAIEDAHRADAFTQEFLPFLIAHLASHETTGFFLIVTTEEMDPRWALPEEGSGTITVLALEPYPREVIGPALNRLLGQNVTPSFLSALMRYSEGYPGRILEFLEYCRADGVLVRTESGWIIHERENLASAFPRSLEDSFRRKVSRLDRADLVILAAVAESPVPVRVQAVAFAADMPVSETTERLTRLADVGLVSLSDRTVSPLHPILAGIVEGTEDEKRRTHDRYFAWYRSRETKPDEGYAIAVHAFGSSARADSIPLLLDAAEQRKRLYDYHTAESLITKALAVTREKGETELRFEILATASETANLLGKRDAEEEYIEEMLVLAARSGSPDRLARVYRHQADYHLAVGEFDRARKSAEKALEQYSAAGDRRGQAYCHRKIGFVGYRTQPGERVIEQYRRALEMYRVEDERADEADTLVDIGLVYYSILNDPPRALEHFDRARTLFAEIGDRRGLIRADGNAGAQYYALGDFERALEHHRRVHAAASEIGDRRYTATSLGAMGQCEIALSRFSDAYAHLQEELRIAREIRDTYLEELCLENLGELFLMLGAYDRSIESYTAARKLAERSGNLVGTAACDIDIAGALIAKRDTEAAAKLLAGARRVLEESRDVNVFAMYQYRMGMLYLARGSMHDPARAMDAFHQLGETADANGFRSHRILSRSYAAFCRMLLGHPAEARELSMDALAILESGGPLYGGCQDVLLNHALILRANRDLEAFVEYIDRAHAELMSAAESIHDVHLYRSFLEHVPVHAEIVREYALAHRADSQSAAAAIREQNLRTLYDVARNINSVLELPLLLDRIMDSALAATNGERGLIFLIENDQLVLKVSRNVEKETIRDATEISLSILRDVVSGGRPIIVSDTSQDTAFRNRESVRNYHIHSLVCVPMRAKDRLIGTVYVDSRAGSLRTMSFTDIDAEFLEAFANLAAIAIENARLHARLQDENLYLQKTVNRRFGFENIIGESAPMMKLFVETQAAIGSEAAVLISGESGTGKELIAKAIHYNGSRKSGRFVAVDCGALPDTLLESELFGYKRGAFTGAYTDKPGLFEEAHNGTLFLDEISNTSIAFQAKLLRVLQDGEFRRVGDTTTRTVNVRIICATNRNLAEEIEHGRFRQDLYYRLNVIPITVPPLRDRVSDIPLLVQYFIDRFKAKSPSPVRGATSELLDALKTLPWKGNVRELENLINRMLTQAESDMLTTRDLPPEYQGAASQERSPEIPVTLGITRRLATLQQVEREHILFVLQHTKGNKTEAARILGVKRTTLIERMKKLGLM